MQTNAPRIWIWTKLSVGSASRLKNANVVYGFIYNGVTVSFQIQDFLAAFHFILHHLHVTGTLKGLYVNFIFIVIMDRESLFLVKSSKWVHGLSQIGLDQRSFFDTSQKLKKKDYSRPCPSEAVCRKLS